MNHRAAFTGEPKGSSTARVEQISAILQEASHVHHAFYRKWNGDDPDWASWYADWLVNFSDFPEVLGEQPVRSELTYLLVLLDREYRQQGRAQGWEDWYAERILAHFSSE